MILVDTGYLIALADPRDSLHQRALAWGGVVTTSLVVTEYVIWETVNALSNPFERSRAHRLVQLVRNSPGYTFLSAEPRLFEAGLTLHGQRSDKEWSLTDCISFHVMQERGLTEALAYDHHFEQAGFAALLRRDP